MSKMSAQIVATSPCGGNWTLITSSGTATIGKLSEEPQRTASALARAAAAGPIVLLTPSSWWQAFHLEYPKLSRAKAARALEFEAESLSPVPIQELRFALPIGQTPGKPSLLIGLDLRQAIPTIDEMNHAGLNIESVSPLAFSVSRCAMQKLSSDSVVVHGHDTQDLVSFEEGLIRRWRSSDTSKAVRCDAGASEVAYSVRTISDRPPAETAQTHTVDPAELLEIDPKSAGSVHLKSDDGDSLVPALRKWSTPAGIAGIALLLLAIGFWRRSEHLNRAALEEIEIQQTQYTDLFPRRPIPPVPADRLASELRLLEQESGKSAAEREQLLAVFRDVLLDLPDGSSQSIRELRLNERELMISGTTQSHASANSIGRAISLEASIKTSTMPNGRIQFEIQSSVEDLR